MPTDPPPSWRAAGLDARSFHAAVLHLTVGGASERPLVAVRVLSAVFALLPPDSRELGASRAQIALEAHCKPADASRALSDLVRLGVLVRRGEARATRYAVDSGFAGRTPVTDQGLKAGDTYRAAMAAAVENFRAGS